MTGHVLLCNTNRQGLGSEHHTALAGSDPGFFAGGGGVNDGRVQRADGRRGGLGLINIRGSSVDKHQIKVHSVHRIFRTIFFFFLL